MRSYSILIIKTTIFAFLLVFISFFYLSNLSDQSMHEDEYVWVYRGGRHFQALISRDFSDKTWQHYYSYDQPKLAEFGFGAVTWLIYRQNIDKLFKETSFNRQGVGDMGPRLENSWWVKYQAKDSQFNAIPGPFQPAYQIIVKNRLLSVVFGLGLLWVIFLIGRAIGGNLTGLISMIVVAQHPLIYRGNRRAMADSMLLFFLLGGVYLFLILKNKVIHDKKNPVKALICLGIWGGLAASVKLNGFMVLVLMSIWLGLGVFKHLIQKSKRGIKRAIQLILKTIAINFIGFSVFVLINPFTWPNPIFKTYEMIKWRSHEATKLQEEYQDSSFATFGERIKAVVEETILPSGGDQRILAWVPAKIELMVFITGLILILFEAIIRQTRQEIPIFLFFAFGTLLIMAKYLTVGFDRYFMPIIPYIAIIETYAIGRIWQYMVQVKKLLRR